MASATPVIAGGVQGILDIVIDGYNGLLVDPSSEHDIVEKIISMIEDEDKLMKLRENCLNFIKDFDWEIICEKTLKVYGKNIINGARQEMMSQSQKAKAKV